MSGAQARVEEGHGMACDRGSTIEELGPSAIEQPWPNIVGLQSGLTEGWKAGIGTALAVVRQMEMGLIPYSAMQPQVCRAGDGVVPMLNLRRNAAGQWGGWRRTAPAEQPSVAQHLPRLVMMCRVAVVAVVERGRWYGRKWEWCCWRDNMSLNLRECWVWLRDRHLAWRVETSPRVTTPCISSPVSELSTI